MRLPAFCRMSLFLCASLSASGVSLAATPQAPPGDAPAEKSNDQKVIELFDRGTSFYLKQQWAEAETAFQAAWDLKQSYDIAGNLGEVELKIGQVREATEHLAFSLRQFPPTGKEAHRKQLQRFFDEARKEVVAFRVYVNVDGAQIVVNGRHVGQSPMPEPVYIEPGKVTFEATLAGHERTVQTVESTKGWSEDISIIVRPKVAAPVQGPIKEPSEPAPSAGFLDGKSRPLLITGVAVTGAAVIAGVALTLLANGKGSDADAEYKALKDMGLRCSDQKVSARCMEQKAMLEDQSALSNAAVGVFAAGGAAAVGTLVYMVWPVARGSEAGATGATSATSATGATGATSATSATSAKKIDSSAFVRPVPVVTASGGGVWMTGTF